MADTDLSKIVNLIMENPKLIEEIKSMASGASESGDESEKAEAEAIFETEKEETVKEASTPPITSSEKIRRKDLLCALKPYVSPERARAIDSMLSVAEILDMIKR